MKCAVCGGSGCPTCFGTGNAPTELPSMRDRFAMAALPAVKAYTDFADLAYGAYLIADAMLAERAKAKP